MRKQLLNLKILYSIDTDEMVKLQKAWSLSSEEAKTKACEWIDERCKVIQKGKDCLIKLENICKGNNASEVVQEIHVAVRKRIKVGESCLEAWIPIEPIYANLVNIIYSYVAIIYAAPYIMFILIVTFCISKP